ncbi:MAG: PAS domain S-box protein [Nitrospirae bacterium]|nr:PAS domain S-box protein [Nitrospirota bacterium]MBF0592396.1 PAS domain S-box protein [Nitrospirota bacterium]
MSNSILVVDDSPHIRKQLEVFLRAGGFEDLHFEESAVDMFNYLSHINGDINMGTALILLDIEMPGMDGIEACNQIKDTEHLRDIPVVMVTGKNDAKSLQSAFTAGAVDYVTKPINKIELIARVKSVLKLQYEMGQRILKEKELEEAIKELKLSQATLIQMEVRQRQQVETLLKESEEKFHTITMSAQDAIILIDDNGNVSFWNQAATRTFGYTADEVIGKNLHLLIAHREYREIIERNFPIFSGTGEGSVIDKTLELTANRKDGSVFPVELSVSSLKIGGRWHAVGIARDITSRKQNIIALEEAMEKLRKLTDAVTQAMAAAVEARDPYTAGHQRRVSELSRAIATEMSLGQQQIDGVRVAATIHDIGKITVPGEILSKPGKISIHEFNLIKEHSQIGYDILKGIEFPYPVAQIILQHHERLDGSGYPNGLRGDEICIEARIICVADVVEAMANHRPYRPALGIQTALGEIVRGVGTSYDPNVVDACVRVFDKGFKF